MTFLPEPYGAVPVEQVREVEVAGRGDVWAARERTHTTYARPIPDPEPEPAPRARRGAWAMPFLAGTWVMAVVAITEAALLNQLAVAGTFAATFMLIALVLHGLLGLGVR